MFIIYVNHIKMFIIYIIKSKNIKINKIWFLFVISNTRVSNLYNVMYSKKKKILSQTKIYELIH